MSKRKRKNWTLEVLPHIIKQLEEFDKEGIVPTLRTIFYRLTPNIIRNIKNDYTYLSEFTTKCRKRSVILKRVKIENVIRDGLSEEIKEILYSHSLLIQYNRQRHMYTKKNILKDENGKRYVLKLDHVLRVDCFADETRGVFGKFIDEYETPQRHITKRLDFLGDLHSQYNKLIPKWHKQPYYVELWTEKSAMVGTFRSILHDQDVRIVFNRGFDSMSNTWQTYQRIKKAWADGKKVRILYFGDLDPSGDAMDDIINENLDVCFDVKDFKEQGLFDFKRVGILFEQIDKFHLPKNLDDDVLAKLKKDKRKQQFMKKYNLKPDDDLFQIEIDALAAANPAEFKKMVLDEINPLYDVEIYEGLLSDVNHSQEQISLHVRKNVQKFIENYNIKLFMESTF